MGEEAVLSSEGSTIRNPPLVLVLPESGSPPLETIAHELKSPVKAVQLLAEAVRASAGTLSSEQLERSMDSILRSVRYMADLVGRLAGPNDLRPTPVDLGLLVLETVEDMSGLLDGHPIQLGVGPVGVVPADPIGIREVVVNLLSNASRYARPRTPISITVRSIPWGVALAVADRCGGIPEGLRSRVFEPFVRGEAGAAGAGLGLSISRSIARAHGGDLTVDQAERGGCRFTLTLPSAG